MNLPHDTLAKFAFGDPVRAAEELAFAVGGPSGLIDWTSLTPDPTELSDAALGRSIPDLRWSARLGEGEVRLGLIFEHQSAPDPTMAVRLFCHTGAI